jgi:hypothetical protein
MLYSRLVCSRAFNETKLFWNVHRVWAYLSVPASALILRVILRGVAQLSGGQEVAEFVVFGFIVSWVGTYLINIIRAPGLLHKECQTTIDSQAKEIGRLNALNEAERKVDLSFRLKSDATLKTEVEIWFQGQRFQVPVSRASLCVLNKGAAHCEVISYSISQDPNQTPKKIQADLPVPANGLECELDVTHDLILVMSPSLAPDYAAILSPPKPRRVSVSIEYEPNGEPATQTKPKLFDVRVKQRQVHIGLAVELEISPVREPKTHS